MDELRETLVAKLRERGITYLAPSDVVATESMASPDAPLVALLEQPDSRLQLAVIPLLLRHPELASRVPLLVTRIEPRLAIELQTLYMAAVCLQRLWKTRLGFYLDTSILLPDLFRARWHYRPPMSILAKRACMTCPMNGKHVRADPFDRLAALNNTMDLFFAQLKSEQSHAPTS